MARRDQILAHLDALLEIERFDDYCANGLQLPGAPEVKKIVTGVSAGLELIERAAAADAQLLIAHHGLFWGSGIRAISERDGRRLRAAFAAGLSIAAYHLPLDAHPVYGNNALIRDGLGLEPDPIGREFAPISGVAIGTVGVSTDPLSLEELVGRVERLVARTSLVFDTGPAEVGSVAIISGGGSKYVTAAAELGVDALITGEPSEPAMADAAEAGIHFIAAGHYSTETFGVRAIGELCAQEFGVEHEFIEIPNPV